MKPLDGPPPRTDELNQMSPVTREPPCTHPAVPHPRRRQRPGPTAHGFQGQRAPGWGGDPSATERVVGCACHPSPDWGCPRPASGSPTQFAGTPSLPGWPGVRPASHTSPANSHMSLVSRRDNKPLSVLDCFSLRVPQRTRAGGHTTGAWGPAGGTG